MPASTTVRGNSASEYKAIAKKWATAKKIKERRDVKKGRLTSTETIRNPVVDKQQILALQKQKDAVKNVKRKAYEQRWWWTSLFWGWVLTLHAIGILLFTRGFLLTRLVLEESSECGVPPASIPAPGQKLWNGYGSVEGGCWHPKSFNKAVIVLVDALRYDFTVPPVAQSSTQIYHNELTYLYETAVSSPKNAFLRPFIADPPTTTLQRLKGLMTGTLPTFIDAGSNFAGTAVEEDNILTQLRAGGKRIAQLGDDTWTALFPDHFEANISRAYDSFNVWDLHTVDNGVIDHILPLLEQEKKGEWDVLIGHLLGVDHAGHRYGPEHPAMADKLKQIDGFIRNVTAKIDEDTLLIVMGDHGMDAKGDHGGESNDEVEAAIWMYSKRPFFGRVSPEFAVPPVKATIRPISQIDLVPTLSLLLGIPIPYNNLGGLIEEAFIGLSGKDWDTMAHAARIIAAQIQRYQGSYYQARGLKESMAKDSPLDLWNVANTIEWRNLRDSFDAFAGYQYKTLAVCRSLWARFDVPLMITGILIMALGVFMLVTYAAKDEDEDFAILDDMDLEFAETGFEMSHIGDDEAGVAYKTLHKRLVVYAMAVGLSVAGVALLGWIIFSLFSLEYVCAAFAVSSTLAVFVGLHKSEKWFSNIIPTNIWGILGVTFTLTQSIGFASNSFTIWEDSISLFMISTFGICALISSLSIRSFEERTKAVTHSIMFIILGRVASVSKLCREEQIPYCTSTYYASSSSSTSSISQLVIPFVAVFGLPIIIKGFLMPSKSYQGFGPIWIGIFFRVNLALAAVYWVIDAANNGNWFPTLPEGSLKTGSIILAQITLGLSFVVGSVAFAWAPPLIGLIPAREKESSGSKFVILGFGNAHGARYLMFPLNLLGACILLSKPMGIGALGLMLWQTLCLVEILDYNVLINETIGPVMLAILGNFYFFTTGHQATLASIQWDSAFVPLTSIVYPWSPIFVVLNTFAGQIMAVAFIPLLVLWKVNPKRRGILESVCSALASFVSFYAVEALATMIWAGYLRRHLMLYRVFSPRFMMAGVVLLVVDFAALVLALVGIKVNTSVIADVFGWAD